MKRKIKVEVEWLGSDQRGSDYWVSFPDCDQRPFRITVKPSDAHIYRAPEDDLLYKFLLDELDIRGLEATEIVTK